MITRGLTTLLDLTNNPVRPTVLPNITEAIESMVMPDYGDKFHTGSTDIEYIDADGNPVYD